MKFMKIKIKKLTFLEHNAYMCCLCLGKQFGQCLGHTQLLKSRIRRDKDGDTESKEGGKKEERDRQIDRE